jgi:hypothetical protein
MYIHEVVHKQVVGHKWVADYKQVVEIAHTLVVIDYKQVVVHSKLLVELVNLAKHEPNLETRHL